MDYQLSKETFEALDQHDQKKYEYFYSSWYTLVAEKKALEETHAYFSEMEKKNRHLQLETPRYAAILEDIEFYSTKLERFFE